MTKEYKLAGEVRSPNYITEKTIMEQESIQNAVMINENASKERELIRYKSDARLEALRMSQQVQLRTGNIGSDNLLQDADKIYEWLIKEL